MKAVDTNVLVYADRREMPLHTVALARLRALAEGHEAWALPIFCVGEFVRVVSHARLFDPPTPAPQALKQIGALLASPSVRLLSPGNRFVPLLEQTIKESGASGNLVYDAQIAALCLEHGARTLVTNDRDFNRFSSLRIETLDGEG
ncbi:MAG: PIN domain-containing protein [Proteobacteria bacterium]|nr:PIN domain-containing protein [Pseudomonadota bacterium]